MRRGQILLVGAVLIVAAAAAAFLLTRGPSEEDFRADALAACERIGEREAQRVNLAAPKAALEAHRKRLAAALADLRRVEPAGDARPAWEKAVRLHRETLARVDKALKETNGRDSHDSSLLADVEPRIDDLTDDAAALYREAGVPKCSLRDAEAVEAAEAYREKADRSCARLVRAPLVTPARYGEGKAAGLSAMKAVEREMNRMDPPAKPPEVVEAVYRKHLIDRLERMRRRTAEARARIKRGASPAPTVRRLIRAYNNFLDAYFDATFTLRFTECLDEQAHLAQLGSTFRRKARAMCGPAARAIASASDRGSLDGFREAQRREEQLLRRLGKLKPAPRQRQQFREALRAARAMEDELEKLLGRWGTLSLSEANAYDRRLTKLSRRARLAFAPLRLGPCARAF